jgi:hypothetical protein
MVGAIEQETSLNAKCSVAIEGMISDWAFEPDFEQFPPIGHRKGSRTVPIADAKMQVNDWVELGSHNKNQHLTLDGPALTLDRGWDPTLT